jgi:hypothetical protein
LCRNLYTPARRPAVNNIVKYLIIAFVLFFVVTEPDNAASIISKGINGLQTIGNGVSTFVTQTAL